ncbi:alpha/beta fold hydrolase [Gordonia soli]|uniref:Putative hydrolase n=1 Tax=Gordonia soli NBRC 108243 TaxID=1223545 RepID=M0QJX9_9ACTN|nr:alpha/beta hydrolase [Gordonia soli]GAC68596.1 putative hydrolase [Gordonia soli NBRC 108243]
MTSTVREYTTISHPEPNTRIWHEVTGDGPPTVLLHGAFAGASSWGAQVPAFVDDDRRVYVPERHGHGRSPDVTAEFHYVDMALETIVYLDEIVGAPADIVGWSDGAVVGAIVALRRPDLVRRLVLIGQYFNSSGRASGGILDELDSADSDLMEFFRAAYAEESPDGAEHFSIVFDKTMAMIGSEPEIPIEDLGAIAVPTLVLQGDRDEVTLDHSREVVDAIDGARLAVIPGTHLIPLEAPIAVNSVILQFLDAP